MNSHRDATLAMLFAMLAIACPGQEHGFAEEGVARSDTVVQFDVTYVPDQALAVVYMPVKQILSQPAMEWLPIEIAQAAMQEAVGVDLLAMEDVTVVIGMPGPAGVQVGAAVKFNDDVDVASMSRDFLVDRQAVDQNGIAVHRIALGRGGPPAVMHLRDSRTALISMGDFLPSMLQASQMDAEAPRGPLPALVKNLNRRDGITAIASITPIRPVISQALQGVVSEMPPEIRGLSQFADLTDALLVSADYGLLEGSLTVSALCSSEDAATRLSSAIRDALEYGRDMVFMQVKASSAGEGPIAEATERYADRIAPKVMALLQPQQRGRIVTLRLEGSYATTGVLVGLLLPAVQAAREAARRMTASNGLKLIGLAMHNHHAAYGSLPDRAIRDEAGKPLLSWRVALLPFLDQVALYEQFHLDEPWDSPHNRSLIPLMPEAFVDPSVRVEPGKTVFQACVGDKLMFPSTGQRRFRDVVDGLSNTLMVVESSLEEAVYWTQPKDLAMDLENPLPQLGNVHPGGFHVLMGDGAVRFLAHETDPSVLQSMFTHAGREAIGK
ncbi:MAG: DUF1559 domain-containing protein [Planctomycetota bacterium]